MALKAFFTLITLGFEHSKADNSMFFQRLDTHMAIVLIYVDDTILTGSDSAYLKELTVLLNNSFALKGLDELSFFLGIEIKRDDDILYINQHKYIADLLLKHGLDSTTPIFILMTSRAPLSKFDGNVLTYGSQYRQVVGA